MRGWSRGAKTQPSRQRRQLSTAKKTAAAVTIQRAVKNYLSKKVETKRSNYTPTDGVEIYHNSFVTLNSKMLATTQGTLDPQSTAILCRVGDEINLTGVSIKFMVELNERYSDVTFRFVVIKCAKGDVPTRDTLYNGLSGNKMIDTFNTERYTIIKSKTFKITAPNTGISAASFAGGYDNATTQTFSKATKIMKFYIPGKKFVKSGILKYENGSDQPKFFDYHALIYAYSNYGTFQDVYYVARVNDYVQTNYFKDP